MRWKFSHLKNTLAPVSASTVLELSTGVRFACARMRSCAAATSSKETGNMSGDASGGMGEL